MNHEDSARKNHRSGLNCAQSVSVVYADQLGMTSVQAMQSATKPRSEGGKCGAFLAGKAVLEKLKPEAVAEYERAFIEANGMTECSRLVMAHGKLGKSCNDYVGDASRLVEALLK